MGSPDSAVPADVEARPELTVKLELLTAVLEDHHLGAIRLRGQDWFAWATCGGSNAVLMATDAGVAEVLVTRGGTRVVTNAIEAERLRLEELPKGLEVVEVPWAAPGAPDEHVRASADGGPVASDVPGDGEVPLPAELVAAKRRLLPAEIERYRAVGRAAAEALSDTLQAITPSMTEYDVAGIGASALLRRGLDPALILVAGSRRIRLHRHPRPTHEVIGDRVGVVFCGRRAGLFANLTRFAAFREPTDEERQAAHDVAQVEATAFGASVPGATLGTVFAAMSDAYARLGHEGAELDHHQGGTTGYRSREVVATPDDPTVLEPVVALAWNPSLPGTKIEDTVLLGHEGLEILTVDPSWPVVHVEGRARPDVLVRT